MKLIPMLAVAAGIATAPVEALQNRQVSYLLLANGLTVSYETVWAPEEAGAEAPQLQGGAVENGTVMQRYVLQGENYFGYDLEAAPLDNNRVQVTIRPLTLSQEAITQRHPGVRWRLRHIDVVSQSQILSSSEAVEVDLFVNRPATVQQRADLDNARGQTRTTTFAVTFMQKVVDRVRVSNGKAQSDYQRQQISAVLRTAAARSLSVGDIPLRIQNARLAVSRRGATTHFVFKPVLIEASKPWISVAELGHMTLSLVPAADFSQVGTVDGDRLTFSWGGATYSLTSTTPIVPASGTWLVYGRMGQAPVGTMPLAIGPETR